MNSRAGRKAKTDTLKVSELIHWIATDKNRQAGIKCQALISLTKGVRVTDVCKVLNVTRESVRLWRKTVEIEGPTGFLKVHNRGRKSGLTPQLKELLKTIVIQTPEQLGYSQAIWDGKLVCRYLKEKKDIAISVRTAQNWLGAIDFTRQKPRRKYKQTNETELDTFKKKY